MDETFKAGEIPSDLKACQKLIKQLTNELGSHTHTIDAHISTILELQQKQQQLEQDKVELLREKAELVAGQVSGSATRQGCDSGAVGQPAGEAA